MHFNWKVKFGTKLYSSALRALGCLSVVQIKDKKAENVGRCCNDLLFKDLT